MSKTVPVYFADHEKVVDAPIGASILELAEQHDIDLDHACGGVCACSTCHVKILAGAELLSEASEDEEDQLDTARDLDLTSRLGCQARIERSAEGARIDVKIPAWNINLVQEGH